jgi:hypothetical protein
MRPQFWRTLVGLAIVALLGWLLFLAFRGGWRALVGASPQLAGALVAGATTIIVGTVTVMLGRHYERKRDIEAHFRADKIKIYDEFLQELFKVLHAGIKLGEPGTDEDLVKFMREWQRKLVLWGGSNVLRTYFRWMGNLKQGNPDVQTLFLMDEFFRALRSDIGQSSAGLERGAFAHLVLRYGEFFLEQARRNPSMTLHELSELEKKRFGS